MQFSLEVGGRSSGELALSREMVRMVKDCISNIFKSNGTVPSMTPACLSWIWRWRQEDQEFKSWLHGGKFKARLD